MGGKFGVEATEAVLSAIKLAVISDIQAARDNGFEFEDVFAFLASQTFKGALDKAVASAKDVAPELNELDLFDDLELGKFLLAVVSDIKTELRVPVLDLKKRLAS